MILVARDAGLPAAVALVKKEVLVCLRAVHHLHEYESASDLIQFLDANLAAAGLTGLTRVVLFYQDPQVRIAVEKRMAVDGQLNVFQQPGCWMQFQAQLPELRARAEQYEPGFVAQEMAKD